MVEMVLKVVSVFIGSPGGLEPERRAAKGIVEEINQNHAEHWGCHIKLVGWEATLPGYSRAQSLINQDLDKCDYFIGVVWDHWGSKPDDGESEYTSGFHEEFERATKRYKDGLMKNIALFFKDIPEKQLKDPGESCKQVIAFRQKCIKERKPLFKTFNEVADFNQLFRASIEAIGWREFTEAAASARELAEPEQPERVDARISDAVEPQSKLIDVNPSRFIRDLLGRSSEWEATNAFEIARMRLIALSLSREGNDTSYLGNHDANLLFRKRKEYDFDEKERIALANTRIAGFHHQNVPLWSWLAQNSSEYTFLRPRILSFFGGETEKINSIKVLQCAGQSTPVLGGSFTRDAALSNWLVERPSDALFSAAVNFLITNGQHQDAEIIENLIPQVMSNRRSALVGAYIHLLASINISDALEKLIEFNPDSLERFTADAIFASPSSIPTSTAQQLVVLKSNAIRKAAAALLSDRRAFPLPSRWGVRQTNAASVNDDSLVPERAA